MDRRNALKMMAAGVATTVLPVGAEAQTASPNRAAIRLITDSGHPKRSCQNNVRPFDIPAVKLMPLTNVITPEWDYSYGRSFYTTWFPEAIYRTSDGIGIDPHFEGWYLVRLELPGENPLANMVFVWVRDAEYPLEKMMDLYIAGTMELRAAIIGYEQSREIYKRSMQKMTTEEYSALQSQVDLARNDPDCSIVTSYDLVPGPTESVVAFRLPNGDEVRASLVTSKFEEHIAPLLGLDAQPQK